MIIKIKKLKKALAIAGILALSITPTASFAFHLEPKESELRPVGNLAHTDLSHADLSGITATNLRACPSSLPSGWVCENNSLIQR